jgi:hypothetical protein
VASDGDNCKTKLLEQEYRCLAEHFNPVAAGLAEEMPMRREVDGLAPVTGPREE